MLRQEELAFIKALYTMQPTPALLELRTALGLSKKEEDSGVRREPWHHAQWCA